MKQQEKSWFFIYWRPAMAWSYLVVCMFDFLIAPILMGIYAYYTGTTMIPWEPTTIKGGAIYHISMGAVTGIATWSRGKEKMAVLSSAGEETSFSRTEETRVTPRKDKEEVVDDEAETDDEAEDTTAKKPVITKKKKTVTRRNGDD